MLLSRRFRGRAWIGAPWVGWLGRAVTAWWVLMGQALTFSDDAGTMLRLLARLYDLHPF